MVYVQYFMSSRLLRLSGAQNCNKNKNKGGNRFMNYMDEKLNSHMYQIAGFPL